MTGQTWVEKFRAEHLDMIDLRESDRRAVSQIPHFRAACKVYEENGGAYTMFSPDGVVAISGVAPVMPGVGSAWMLLSDLVKKYPKATYKATRDFMQAIEEDWRIHRIQATASAGDMVARNWLRHLGFVEEGTLRQYGPDRSDHVIFGRVKTWVQ